MRLIDADALITEAFDLMDRDELLEDVPQIIKDYCDAQPTVDAVPVKHGHWLVNMFFIECSECGESFPLVPQNYCPNCGARMDEERDSDHA